MKKILILLFFFNLYFINLNSSESTECKEFSKLSAKYYQKKEWEKEKKEWIKEKEKLRSIKDKILKK